MIESRSNITAEGTSTLRYYALTFSRRWQWLVVPLVALPLVLFVLSTRQSEEWDVSADVYVDHQEVAGTSVIGTTPPAGDTGRIMDTQATLARTPDVARNALVRAGRSDASAGSLLGRTQIYPLGDVLRFTVTDSSPERAARLATAYAEAFVAYRRKLDTAGLSRALETLERQLGELEAEGRTASPVYVRLADRERQLEGLRALRLSNVSVSQKGSIDGAEQVAPRPLRNAALGAALGLLLGVILVFVREALSTRPRSVEDLESDLDAPLLGRVDLTNADALLADDVRQLRARIELLVGERPAALLLTAPSAGTGVATLAVSLASSFAEVGVRPGLVDIGEERGSSSMLAADGETVSSAPRELVLRGSAGVPSEDRNGSQTGSTLVVPTWQTGDLEARLAALEEILADLRARCDVTLVVAEPLLGSHVGTVASRATDGIVVVVDEDRIRRPEAVETRRAAAALPVPLLGFALVRGTARAPRMQRAVIRTATPSQQERMP